MRIEPILLLLLLVLLNIGAPCPIAPATERPACARLSGTGLSYCTTDVSHVGD